jgi:hypothetical protein
MTDLEIVRVGPGFIVLRDAGGSGGDGLTAMVAPASFWLVVGEAA